MAVSDAQRKAAAKYLERKKTLTLRMDPEEHAAVQVAADQTTGGSVQGYILQAVRAQMNGTAAPAPSEDNRVHLSIEPSVLEPFRRKGETLTQTAERLLTAGLAAAQRAEK